MNNRIQTLLAKFKETESTHRGAQVLVGFDEIEKFAELLIGECIKIADNDYDGEFIVNDIKKHFGIE